MKTYVHISMHPEYRLLNIYHCEKRVEQKKHRRTKHKFNVQYRPCST